jgi:general stress protein 26
VRQFTIGTDSEPSFPIDEELKSFIESGVAAVIATADCDGHPHMTFVWGPRVQPDGLIHVFLEDARSSLAVEDLRENRQMALTLGSPVSYRSVQLKGRCTALGEAGPADQAWVRRHREAFATETALVGDPPQIIRNLWMEGPLTRIEFAADRAFDQTPGPDAGTPL